MSADEGGCRKKRGHRDRRGSPGSATRDAIPPMRGAELERPEWSRSAGFAAWLLVCLLAWVLPLAAQPSSTLSDDGFLDLLERKAFDYFWSEADPRNGLVRDRSTPDSKCSIAAVGFGLSGIGIAIDRGWLTREEGRARVLTTLRTFAEGPQGDAPADTIGTRGWFYHFLGMDTATRAWKCELSSIDTALLLAGVLDMEMFFDRSHPDERRIRELAGALVRRLDWSWMADGGETFRMGWHPEKGFIAARWTGYNEAMILYLLALGADDRSRSRDPGPGSDADRRKPSVTWKAWTQGYLWQTNGSQGHVGFAPLFGHQYSHCWVDFRGIADEAMRAHGLTYFENSRRATLAQRAYCMAVPAKFPGYGPLAWGITASDGPTGYSARGAPPAENDDGTLAPTAVGGSLPFAPEVCLPTLRDMAARHGDRLWGRYGFRDAYNEKAGWYATDTLGIDQGPILLMAENHRTGAVWRRMMRHPVIQRGLARAGFTSVIFP